MIFYLKKKEFYVTRAYKSKEVKTNEFFPGMILALFVNSPYNSFIKIRMGSVECKM